MKLPLLLLSLAALLFAGCASDVPRPRIQYPVTYQVPIGNTNVRSDYGPQNLSTQAVQQVAVEVGRPLYFQVAAPVDVSVQVNEIDAGARRQASQLQGRIFSGMVTPRSSTLEFVFSSVQANSGGTLQFTLSDRPISP